VKNLALAAGIALCVAALTLAIRQVLRHTGRPGMPPITPHFMADLEAQRDHVTLVLSGRLMAEITPCGCRANRNGGIARIATALRSIQDRSPNIAVLDAGDSLVSADASGRHTVSALTKKKAQVMADFFAATPHDATSLGELDLLRGPA
jgi:2',3'-cyclic-nucleotide 2'-phosphodiesterase (5'-nucleotidase family)